MLILDYHRLDDYLYRSHPCGRGVNEMKLHEYLMFGLFLVCVFCVLYVLAYAALTQH